MNDTHGMKDDAAPSRRPPRQPRRESYRSRDIQVDITEDENGISLALDGTPVEVAYVNGKYYSPTAHMYVEFDTLDEVVDQLIRTSDRYWQLHPPADQGSDGNHGGHHVHHRTPGEGA